jgi:hypothetical protein
MNTPKKFNPHEPEPAGAAVNKPYFATQFLYQSIADGGINKTRVETTVDTAHIRRLQGMVLSMRCQTRTGRQGRWTLPAQSLILAATSPWISHPADALYIDQSNFQRGNRLKWDDAGPFWSGVLHRWSRSKWTVPRRDGMRSTPIWICKMFKFDRKTMLQSVHEGAMAAAKQLAERGLQHVGDLYCPDGRHGAA